MQPSVTPAFLAMNAVIEGALPWMYADRKNLITCGIGNLIDPCPRALSLPWHHLAGERGQEDATRPFNFQGPLATPAEIQAAWNTVKQANATGWASARQGTLTDLRLDEEGVMSLVHSALTTDESVLKLHLTTWANCPADAQLALLSMSYAMGCGFVVQGSLNFFPKLTHAVSLLDFTTAAAECAMSPSTDSALRRRNNVNRELFLHAADVMKNGADKALLSMTEDDIVAMAEGYSSPMRSA